MPKKNVAPSRQRTAQRIVEVPLQSRSHVVLWALLSITTFIVIFLACTELRLRAILCFGLAGIGMIIILILEGILRGRIWLFEPTYMDFAGHRATSGRILVFAGGMLLILETALLIGFATDQRFDAVMLRMIEHKHCLDAGRNC